ncbi:MAG: hypothetical protein FWF98_06105, partial [Dehalococcoidia bacterium]|nr:hypothetical protein [Dehalococcoidia bacterium]
HELYEPLLVHIVVKHHKAYGAIIVDGTHHIDPFPLTLYTNDGRLAFRRKSPLIMWIGYT